MEKIIEALAEYFSPKFKDKLKRAQNLEALILKLEKKEASLQASLEKELPPSERQIKETKLAVLIAQKKKAMALLTKNETPE